MLERIGGSVRAVHSSWMSVDFASVALRVALGAAFVAHGGQKLFGLFGGSGIDGTTVFLRMVAGVPAPHVFAYVVGITEFFGGVCLLLGAVTMIATVGLIIDMSVAIATVSSKAGFFVIAQKIGWELNVYLLGLLVALLAIGPGVLSLDALLGLTRRPRGPLRLSYRAEQPGRAGAPPGTGVST